MEPKTKKLIKYLIVPLVAVLSLVFAVRAELAEQPLLRVHYYDVGQGDSIFIQTAGGNQILIDGGPGAAVLNGLGEDMPFYDRTIELVVLSHPHADHVSGLIDVIERYRIGKILMPEVEFESAAFKALEQLIDQRKIERIFARQGMRIQLDRSTVFDIYYPLPGRQTADNSARGLDGPKRNPNDVSVVGMLSYGQTKFLFTGDAGFDIEQLLLPRFDLDADVLKVGHQGSKFSTSPEFLEEVTPVYSVISVGKNSYGHPAPEVLDKLEKTGGSVLRTDRDGTVRLVSDGANIIRQ